MIASDRKLFRCYNRLEKSVEEGEEGSRKGEMRNLLGSISHSLGVGSEPLWGDKKLSETEEGVSCSIWWFSQGR